MKLAGTTPGSISVHLIGFCRFLRSKGFLIGSQEEIELFKVLASAPFPEFEAFRLTLAQLLCKSRNQQMEFTDLFHQYWQELFESFDAKIKRSRQQAEHKQPVKGTTLASLKNWLYQNQGTHQHETAFYGGGINVAEPNIGNIQVKQIRDLIRIVQQLANNWASKPSRRKIPSKSQEQIDLRRVLRRNLPTGELIDISFRAKKIQKPRLIVVGDISKSMELYTSFTVQMLYAFQKAYRSLDTFVFGTELYHVSKILNDQSFKQALVELSSQVPDWSGGTRIGHCLNTLIQDYGSLLLHGKVIFLMISDGWDTGELELLDRSMQYINRRVKQVVWLNPQASQPGFTPKVQGMLTALPYVDILHGVHDIESLKDLNSIYKGR